MSAKQRRKLVNMTLANGDAAGLSRAPAGSALSPDAVITLAQYAPAAPPTPGRPTGMRRRRVQAASRRA